MKKIIRTTSLMGLACMVLAVLAFCVALVWLTLREQATRTGYIIYLTGFFIWFVDVILIAYEKYAKKKK